MSDEETLDRALIADFLTREWDRHGGIESVQRMGKPSRSTLYRIQDANPKVDMKSFRQAEVTLKLPYDTVTMVGSHDWNGLRDAEIDPAIIRWLKRRVEGRGGRAATA